MALSRVGVKPKTSEPKAPQHSSQIASVFPCLPKLPGVFRATRRPRQAPLDDEGSSTPAQLQICPDVARRVALVDPQLRVPA